MQWYKESTGELQTEDPGKNCFGELLALRREGWIQVADDFKPPAKTLTADEQIAAIESEYQPKFEAYEKRLLAILAAGGNDQSTKLASLQLEYAALSDEKDAKIQAILEAVE